MPIEFACPECQKEYRVKDELAGKSAKCAKCSRRTMIPDPAVAALSPEPDLGNWPDDELAAEASNGPESHERQPVGQRRSSVRRATLLFLTAQSYAQSVASTFATAKNSQQRGSK